MTDTSSQGNVPDRAAADSLDGRAIVYGEVLLDHFPDGSKVLGGAPFNVAWHLCGFGGAPILVSAVGDDREGREILDAMHGWGLSTMGLGVHDDKTTGRVVVTVDDGHPSYEIPPHQAWDDIPLPTLPLGAPGVVYHGTLALRTPEALERCLELRADLEAPVFVDLNLREPWWTPELIGRSLASVAWVKASDAELAEVTGLPTGTVDEVTEAARRLLEIHAVGTVLVTRGARGAVLVSAGGDALVTSAVEAPDVVDTVGAGDAFSAVVCQGLLEGWDEERTLERASRFAADICRIRGATNTDLSMYERHLRRWAEPPASVGDEEGLHIVSLSVHGLVRGEDVELGRDPDTGGQVTYVLDQARALARHPEVSRVTVITRLVEDYRVDDSYAVPEEDLGDGARIVRLPFGPRRYLRKETLWPHLDGLLDQLTRWVRTQPRPPDLVHGHYADAGYVGAQLSKLLGVPLLFTGHSLGRVKRARLLADGTSEETIESRYRISRRIEAEEQALEAADLIFASTRQEVAQQFEGYDHYQPARMRVIPPGVDLSRFSPPPPEWVRPPAVRRLSRFLEDMDRPAVFAIARPDERKNFNGLIEAYAATPELRAMANLILIAGSRDDVREMDPAQRRVLVEILHLIDLYDLYGSVAYPKRHRPRDVPELYRYTASVKGVFVNAALTEPFGLTLLEAAATGLPVVATNDGGPRDILSACEHGVLADPLDPEALGATIQRVLTSEEAWGRWSKNGVSRVHERFSWSSHAASYVAEAKKALAGTRRPVAAPQATRLAGVDRLVVTDVDDTLTGDDEAARSLVARLEAAGVTVGFGIATGRRLEPALGILSDVGLRTPDLLVTSSGTEIHYGRRLIRDRSWERQIRHRWEPDRVRETLADVAELVLDDPECTDYRLRYRFTGREAADAPDIRRRLRREGVGATVMVDHGTILDIVPVRASPGLALRFFGFKWNLEPGRILVAGDSGNDLEMLAGDTLGVVVGNHTDELDELENLPRVYFAEGRHAWGVLEGIEHYDFFGTIRAEDTHSNHR